MGKIKRGDSGGDEAGSLNPDGNASPPAYFVPAVGVAYFDWSRKVRGALVPAMVPIGWAPRLEWSKLNYK